MCSPFITLCFGSIQMNHVINESCKNHEGTILQKNYRKMTIQWSFSYNSFVKIHGNIFVSHKMTMLYPNLSYNKVCYKGTAL